MVHDLRPRRSHALAWSVAQDWRRSSAAWQLATWSVHSSRRLVGLRFRSFLDTVINDSDLLYIVLIVILRYLFVLYTYCHYPNGHSV